MEFSLTFHIFNALTVLLGTTAWIFANKDYNKRKSLQLLSYIPTVWTSLGILFTFISIVWSLLNISFDDNGSNILPQLIQNVIPAFSTSIIGIIGAVISSWVIKLRCSKEDAFENEALDRFSNRTLGKNDYDNAEIILLGLVREISDGLKLSNSALEKLMKQNKNDKEEIILQVDDYFTKNKDQFTAALEQLKKDFSSAVNTAQSNHETNLKELLSRFEADAKDREQKHTSIINNLYEADRDHIKLLSEQMKRESETRESSIRSYIENGEESFKKYVNDQNEHLSGVLAETKDSLQTILNSMTELFNVQIQETINKFADEQRDGCSIFIKEQIQEFIEKSNEAINKLALSMGQMSNRLIESIDTINQDVEQTMKSLFEEGHKRTKAMLDENDKHYCALADEMKQVCSNISKDINGGYSDFKLKFEEICNQSKEFIDIAADNQKDEISKFINDYISNLNVIAEAIKVNKDAINESMEGVKKAIIKSTEDYQIKHEQLKKAIVTSGTDLTKEMSNEIRSAFQVESLKESCSLLAVQISTIIDSITKSTGAIDVSMSNVITALAEHSKLANDTKKLESYVNSTTDLYKQHTTQSKLISTDLENISKIFISISKQISDTSKEFSAISNAMTLTLEKFMAEVKKVGSINPANFKTTISEESSK